MIPLPLGRSSLSILKLPSQSVNMKALILLCVLHSALGQNPFLWSLEDSQDPSRECRKDQGSCGCCKMLGNVDSMRNYVDWSLKDLENEYQKINKTFSNIKKSRTAFSGTVSESGSSGCIGPFGVEQIIKYNNVYINLNNGYDGSTGVFTTPYSGVYSIAFTVYSDAGAERSMIAACAVLLVNQVPVTRTTDINNNDQEDQSTHVIALQLQKGDTVAVILPVGCFLCDKINRYNTFSVFLLYATE